MPPLTAQQRTAVARKAWIQRHANATARAAGTMPPAPKRQRVSRQRPCACGCGTTVSGRARYANVSHRPVRPARRCACGCGTTLSAGHYRYVNGHQASYRRRIRLCRCGCGQIVARRRRYMPGHKPKRKALVRSPFKREKSPTMLLFSGLSGLEKAIGERLRQQVEGGQPLTDEQRAKFARYQHLKAMAVGGVGAATVEMQNEAHVALKFAVAQMLEVVKLVF